jgi:hypothetical protein
MLEQALVTVEIVRGENGMTDTLLTSVISALKTGDSGVQVGSEERTAMSVTGIALDLIDTETGTNGGSGIEEMIEEMIEETDLVLAPHFITARTMANTHGGEIEVDRDHNRPRGTVQVAMASEGGTTERIHEGWF